MSEVNKTIIFTWNVCSVKGCEELNVCPCFTLEIINSAFQNKLIVFFQSSFCLHHNTQFHYGFLLFCSLGKQHLHKHFLTKSLHGNIWNISYFKQIQRKDQNREQNYPPDEQTSIAAKKKKVTKTVTTKNFPKQFSVITVNMNNDI